MFVIALNSMLALFACMLIGFIGVRKNLFDDNAINAFNKLLLNLTAPAMFISAMNVVFDKSLIRNIITATVGGFIFHLGILLVVFIFVKVFKIKIKSVWLLTLTFANIGFMGFPLINDLFGETALFYTSLINISFFVLIFSVGVILLTYEKAGKMDLKKILMNKAFIGAIIGLIVFIIPYQLPEFLSKTISMFGSITPPLSMLLVGAIFAKANVVKALKNPQIYLISLVKLIIIPIIVFFVAKLLTSDKELVMIFTILSATPTAVLCAVLAKEHQNRELLVSEIVFVSTILSLITLPIITYVITL